MRISTIIPAYNADRYVGAALNSVMSQTLPSDEVIVVDDGSTDGTLDVLQHYATHIRIIHLEHGGAARALNVALAAATGDALAFLDADDLWLPEKLRVQAAALSTDNELEAVFGMVQQFSSPDLDHADTPRYAVPADLLPGISKNTLLVRRSAFDRIGYFSEEYGASDFVDWYARANVLGLRSRVLPELVAMRRHHPENMGRRLRSEQQSETLQILKRSLDMRRRRSQPKAPS
jgi:glycosyltransferase involved in cell wall biosynthesis